MQRYEELLGATGERIHYRARRYDASELLQGNLVTCFVNGQATVLENFSISGFYVRDPARGEWAEKNASPAKIELRVGKQKAFEGQAQLRRIDQNKKGTRLALELVGGYLDLGRLMSLHADALLDRELEIHSLEEVEAVPADYRQFCADVIYFLRGVKSVLSGFETRAGERGAVSDDARAEALARTEERAIGEWRKLWRRGNALVESLDERSAAYRAIKSYTEATVTPELMDGAIWNRSYLKPLGYPGDFEIMKMVYQWRSLGETGGGKLMHRLGLDVAECIATRMVMVQRQIARTVTETPEGEVTRVTSLGCGPAQEVVNYLKAERRAEKKVVFTLIDQDEKALEWAYGQTYPEVVRLDGRAEVKCLHVSFTQLLKAWSILQEIGPQDLMYTVGLIDYLSERRARSLAATLFERLAPGGLLIIGNMAKMPQSNLWPMEFVCDWNVIYRDEEDMRRMVEGLDTSSVEVVPDETGRVLMLYARKRG